MNRVLTLVLLLALPALPSQAAMDRALLVGLSASVLRIEAPRTTGGYAIGSAVAVGNEIVITNCHVTRDALSIEVVRGGARWLADAQASDVERDLCLLRVPGLQAQVVPLARSGELAFGQNVTAVGYTGGMGLQNSDGEIVDLHRFDGGRVIRSTNWFSSGASGGGLFDERGRLVGVLTFRLLGGDAHYFAAPTEWVQQMMEPRQAGRFQKVMPLETPLRPYWQVMPASQPRFLQAALMQRDRRWTDLETMATEWSRADPDDGEPWYLLGAALQRLGRTAEARAALECSLRLDPGRSAAREQLARLPAAPATLAPAAAGCRPAPR